MHTELIYKSLSIRLSICLQVVSHALEEYGLATSTSSGEDATEISIKEKVHLIATEIGIETGW